MDNVYCLLLGTTPPEKGRPCLMEDQLAQRLKGVTVDGGLSILGADRCGRVSAKVSAGDSDRKLGEAGW